MKTVHNIRLQKPVKQVIQSEVDHLPTSELLVKEQSEEKPKK